MKLDENDNIATYWQMSELIKKKKRLTKKNNNYSLRNNAKNSEGIKCIKIISLLLFLYEL